MAFAFWELARKNFSQKFQGFRMIGSLALTAAKQYLKIEKKPDYIIEDIEVLSWYVKFDILFLKTADQMLKIQIFKEKKALLIYINQHLQKLGYHQQINDIRLK